MSLSLVESSIKLKMVNHLSQSQTVTSAPNLWAGWWFHSITNIFVLWDTKEKKPRKIKKYLCWSSRKTSGMRLHQPFGILECEHRNRLRPLTCCQIEVWTCLDISEQISSQGTYSLPLSRSSLAIMFRKLLSNNWKPRLMAGSSLRFWHLASRLCTSNKHGWDHQSKKERDTSLHLPDFPSGHHHLSTTGLPCK